MELAREELQSYWEIASITHFCYLFRKKLKVPKFDFEELEDALLEPDKSDGNQSGRWLIDKTIKSLVAGYFGPTKSINDSNFEKFFLKEIDLEWVAVDKMKNPLIRVIVDEDGEEKIEEVDFHSLHVRTKVQLLHKLCDYRLAAPDSSSFVKEAAGRLRHKPIGIDALGYVYWYFHGTRLYREKPRVAKILVERLREPMKPVNGVATSALERDDKKSNKVTSSPSKIPEKKEESEEKVTDELNGHNKTMASGLKNQTTLWNWLQKAQAKPEPRSTTGVPVSILKESWSVVCFTSEDWRKLIDRLKQTFSMADRELAERFKLTYLPKVIDAEAEKQRAIRKKELEERKRILELMPRRCSSRIAEKSSVHESNIIEPKLRTREERAKLRELYQNACSESEKGDNDSNFDPNDRSNLIEELSDIEEDSLAEQETKESKSDQSSQHRYATRRNKNPANEPEESDYSASESIKSETISLSSKRLTRSLTASPQLVTTEDIKPETTDIPSTAKRVRGEC